MKVALVHDWLTGMRGGEKVLEELCRLYPSADIYTLVYQPENVSEIINRMSVRTSFIQRLPFARKRHQVYLPLFPAAIEQFDLSGYDLVISSSHCAAKGVITRPDTCHISYIHAPMRYAWDMYHQYFGPSQSGSVSRFLISLFISYLRLWDRVSADRADYFIANSRHTARRINKHYRRTAEVVYPPIDTDFFTPDSQPRQDYFLVVSALVPYKRIDIAINACNKLKLPLVVIGKGVEHTRLQSMASPVVKFLGYQSDEQIREHYRQCRALLFPGEEDFGIVPLEAQSCGCPVIAYAAGGALETVTEPERGLLFPEQTGASLAQAIERFAKLHFEPELIRQAAMSFSQQAFRRRMQQIIEEKFFLYRQTIEDTRHA